MKPHGQILLDSSDIIYLFGNDFDGYLIDIMGNYYGEVTYQLKYGQMLGNPFQWLFVDFETLTDYALRSGFHCEMVVKGAHYDFLAKLTLV